MTKRILLTFSILASTLIASHPIQAAPIAPLAQTPTQQITPTTPQPPANATITKNDLPEGFDQLPTEVKSQVISQIAAFLKLPVDNLNLDRLFAFINLDSLQIVTGLTSQFPTQTASDQFDATLKQMQQPTEQKRLFSELQAKVKNIQEYQIEVLGYQPINELNNLANGSIGISLSLKVQDQPVQVDMVSFRRNQTGAVSAIVYMSGEKPLVSVGEIARKLDQRISQTTAVVNPAQSTNKK